MRRNAIGTVPAIGLLVAMAGWGLAGCQKGGGGAMQKSETAAGEHAGHDHAEHAGHDGAEHAEAAPQSPPAAEPAAGGKVVTTASGLKYEDLVVGAGASPQTGQIAVVHYTGWLTNGTKFDSSVDRGQPFQFPLGQGRVIQGWDEGVSTMKVGGKRKLMIPPALGYGERGAGGVIPPNADLIFEVELLSVR